VLGAAYVVTVAQVSLPTEGVSYPLGTVDAPLPLYPTGLPRFPDSNPEPQDGWTIVTDQKLVRGGPG